MKKVIVPVDFSDLSKKALSTAERFIKLFGGKITPFHSHIPISELDEPYALGMNVSGYKNFENIEETLEKRLKAFAEKEISSDYLAEPVIAIGNPAQSIVDASEEFDYTIMSTHGRTGFSRFLLGSVAEKVLRLSKTPVLIVENDSNIGNFEKILVTTDFSENATAAYQHAVNIAKETGGKIHLLHVLSFAQIDKNDSDTSLHNIRKSRLNLIEKEYFHEVSGQITSSVLVSDSSPHEAIFDHVQNNSYNVLVMSTLGRSGLSYLMMGSTTANVVRHVSTAVLSIRPENPVKENS